MITDRAQTRIARHLTMAGISAYAFVLTSLAIAPRSELDAPTRLRPTAIDATSSPVNDRSLVLVVFNDDQFQTGSRAASILHQITVDVSAVRAACPRAAGRQASRAGGDEVLMVAPKHDPPALLA